MAEKKQIKINEFEKKISSQNGEDGIIDYIFSNIGTTNKFSVEFGVGDGFESNTAYLLEKKKWNGLMMDYGSDDKIHVSNVIKKMWKNKNLGFKKNIQNDIKLAKKILSRNEITKSFQFDIKNERVTAENIQDLFTKYNVPTDFDLLSIDIDFNDYWVWKSIVDYFPRVVIIEYNSSIPSNESKVVQYDPDSVWDGTNYFGASLLALHNLALQKGYALVGCDSNGINAFFCKTELLDNYSLNSIHELYRSPKYGEIVDGKHIGHPVSDKKMINI